jgi:hypothetical protein
MQLFDGKNVILNKNSKMQILEGEILHITYNEDVIIEIPDIKELNDRYNLLNPKPQKVIQDFSRFLTISTEARHYASEKSPDLKAIAFVITSLAQRILLRFYIKTWKRDKKTKIFESFNEALDWIKSE